jgi:hypothetical protein
MRYRYCWLWGALLGCSTATKSVAVRAACPAPVIDHARSDQLAMVLAGDRRPSAAELSDLKVEIAGVPLAQGCAVAAAVSYANDLAGGVVVFRDSAVLTARNVLAAQSFPGARAPFAAGERRVGFTFLSERGAGHAQETMIVLCSLDDASWIPCASTLVKIRASAAGTAESGGAALASLEMESTTSLQGDTLVISSVSRWSHGGSAAAKPETTVSRLILPQPPR